MSSYYAAVFPDLSKHQWVADVRKAYDPKVEFVEPHITLVNPIADVPVLSLKQQIQRAAETTNVFSTVFRSALLMPEFDQNGRFSAYVFLVPDEGFSAVLKLRDRLYAEELKNSLRLDIPFIPHITIASALSLEGAKSLVDELNGRPIEIPILVERISLVEIAESQASRKVIETFALKNS